MPFRLFLALALLATGLSLPRPGGTSAQPTYRFDHVGTDRGLSQSTVTVLAQDHQGYLWVGTDDGLNRFDGRTLTVYRHVLEDPTTLPGSRITSLYVAPDGDLWVGTMRGLARFDRTTETFHVPPGAPGDPASRCSQDVTTIAPSPGGKLWVGTFSGGLCVLAPDRRSARHVPLTSPDSKKVDRVYALRTDASGIPWAQVGTYANAPNRICKTDEEAETCRFIGEETFSRRIEGSEDLVAVGLAPDLSLARLRPDGGLDVLASPIWSNAPLSANSQDLLSTPDGEIWLASEDDGILTVNPATGTTGTIRPDPDDPVSLSSDNVRSLFQDRQGILWVGTAQGLDRWQPPAPGRFRVVSRGPPASGGLSDARINGIAEARDGAVWAGTRDGLNRLDPETGRVDVIRRPVDGANSNAFWYLYEDASGMLWAGSKRRGLWQIDPSTRRLERVRFYVSQLPELDADRLQVRFIGEDSRGNLWIGLGTGFAIRTPDGRWHPSVQSGLAAPSPLPSPRVNVFYEDRQKQFWAGTDGGLCRLAPESRVPDDLRFTCYTHEADDPTTLGSDVVWTIAEDDQGHLWVGTVGGGLARYESEADAFTRLTTRDGLPNNTVYGLVADRTGVLWATTNAGLARVDPSTRAVMVYTTADGLPGNEFDFMAYHVGRTGTIYFGGPQGLTMFDPEAMTTEQAPVPVVVTGAYVFDRRMPGLFAPGDTLRLRHDQNFFRLAFAALDFRTPERSRYRYRLSGYEAGWRSTTTAAPEATYTRVPPGRYVFEVMALDAVGRPTPPTRLHVIVEPALWQTTGFRGGIAGGVALLGMLGIGLVVRRRQREAAREEAEAAELKRRVAEGRDRERVRLARELHDGPVQDLYRLGHDLDRLRLRADEETPETLIGARSQVTAVATNLREVLATLRPPIIPHLGLPAALEALARRMRRRQPGLAIHLALDAEAAQALPPDVQNAVYRVAQEALNNVTKHAGARSASVSLSASEGGVEVLVRDDGRGFERPPQLLDLARADHFGLVGAAERMDVIGGRLTVESTPGNGTTVHAWVPQGSGPEDRPGG